MSLVGPRPLISDEYEMHTMRMRFGVYTTRPGITGLAQVNGRDEVGPVEKIHYDVQYLREFGFKTDVKILLSTVPKVLCKEGIKDGE
jgi:O-antigen biosynthesis protein WbqP